VFGSRFIGDTHRVLYFWHSIANSCLTTMSNIFTNLNLTDMETCYKVFRKEVLTDIKLKSNRFGFEPEITAKIAKRRPSWRVYEVRSATRVGRTRRVRDRAEGCVSGVLLHYSLLDRGFKAASLPRLSEPPA